MIKKFKDFIKENIDINDSDSTEIISSKNRLNKIINDLKEYEVKKSSLRDIYLNSKSEEEIDKKLISSKFVSGSDRNKKFVNNFLGMSATIFSKERRINKLEEDINKINNDIKEENENISNNPSYKKYGDDNISLLRDKIKNKQKQIEDLKKDVTDSNEKIKIKIQELKKEISEDSNKIKNAP